jgi:hypothetical protein
MSSSTDQSYNSPSTQEMVFEQDLLREMVVEKCNSKYICEKCNKNYDQKQFERDNKNLCSKKCNNEYYNNIVKPRQEKQDAEDKARVVLNYKSVACGGCH